VTTTLPAIKTSKPNHPHATLNFRWKFPENQRRQFRTLEYMVTPHHPFSRNP
jgi:hypothetical protein